MLSLCFVTFVLAKVTFTSKLLYKREQKNYCQCKKNVDALQENCNILAQSTHCTVIKVNRLLDWFVSDYENQSKQAEAYKVFLNSTCTHADLINSI